MHYSSPSSHVAIINGPTCGSCKASLPALDKSLLGSVTGASRNHSRRRIGREQFLNNFSMEPSSSSFSSMMKRVRLLAGLDIKILVPLKNHAVAFHFVTPDVVH